MPEIPRKKNLVLYDRIHDDGGASSQWLQTTVSLKHYKRVPRALRFAFQIAVRRQGPLKFNDIFVFLKLFPSSASSVFTF